MFERLFSEDFSIDLLRSWQKVGKLRTVPAFGTAHTFCEKEMFLVIIQHIVTLPIYGHDALNIRHL